MKINWCAVQAQEQRRFFECVDRMTEVVGPERLNIEFVLGGALPQKLEFDFF